MQWIHDCLRVQVGIEKDWKSQEGSFRVTKMLQNWDVMLNPHHCKFTKKIIEIGHIRNKWFFNVKICLHSAALCLPHIASCHVPSMLTTFLEVTCDSNQSEPIVVISLCAMAHWWLAPSTIWLISFLSCFLLLILASGRVSDKPPPENLLVYLISCKDEKTPK